MNLWQKLFLKISPFDSMDEYKGSKQIHIKEIKKYRKYWQFIVVMLLFFGAIIFLMIILESWILK